jgi:phosphatidylserine/phosphatidylglycerophosphate/cardiolipin synthase-like enzyme
MKLRDYGNAKEVAVAATAMNTLANEGMNPAHIATMLDLMLEERDEVERADDAAQIVWTGPEQGGAESRDTAVVVQELFGGAEQEVLVATFALFDGKQIFGKLAERMAARPDLRVQMFVHVARTPKEVDAPASEVVRRFGDDFERCHWPWKRRPELFYDPRTLSTDHNERISLHAKCIVVDEDKLFVTSANFTEAAQHRNIEVGLCVRNRGLAVALRAQFKNLVAAGKMSQMPGW